MEEEKPCKRCKSKPIVVRVDECYYARCPKCTKWPPYEFLGITPSATIRNWNKSN